MYFFRASFLALISVLKLLEDTDPLTFSLANINVQVEPSTNKEDLRKKYPEVCFWTKSDYDEFTLSPEAQDSKRGLAPWLENEDGTLVVAKQLKRIHNTLHAAWAELVQCQLAPATWTKICMSGKDTVYKIMVKKHLLFALDNNGFKLNMLCINDYPR